MTLAILEVALQPVQQLVPGIHFLLATQEVGYVVEHVIELIILTGIFIIHIRKAKLFVS